MIMNESARILATKTVDIDAGNWTVNLTDYAYATNVSLPVNSTGCRGGDRAESESDVSPQWVLLALVIIPVWILGGNLLVLLAVLFQRNLQNLSNRVIASLAFTDLLLGIFVVPLGIYQLVSQRFWVSIRSWQCNLRL